MHHSFKRFLFGGLLLLLLLPAVQAVVPFLNVHPLNGYTDPVARPAFSWAALKTNAYQPAFEQHLEAELGFRPWFVRLRNQLAYSLFGQLRVEGIFLGKDRVLFQQGPIDTYLGRRFLGDKEIAYRLRRLRQVQDSLQAHGTQFLFVIAPSKARYYANLLPDSSAALQPRRANYDAVREQLTRLGINTLDFNPLFLRWKPRAPYALFPRGGAHWSGYATTLVADTLFHRLETLTGKDFPDFGAQGVAVVTTPRQLRYTDGDLMELCNLIWDEAPYPTAYPNVQFGPATGKYRPNVLIVGDSFSQSFYGFYPYYQTLFDSRSRFWFYNDHVYWPEETPGESRNVHELNLRTQLAGRDVVLFISMEENLSKLGFGFIDDAFNLLIPTSEQSEARIREIEAAIRNTPDWLKSIAEKAAANHITLDEAIHKDAAYMQSLEQR